MSSKLQPVRGTHDLIGKDYRKYHHIVRTAEKICELYGYDFISTPIFEYTSVFKRTLGETSDVVGKEMYTFTDRGGEEITLRPEGTASVVRAIISGGLTQSFPLKLAYHGPMMRYERPQLGRTRQFHQFGAEHLGPSHPLADVETIALGSQILQELGLWEKVKLEINTLGDSLSRANYREALVHYLTPYRSDLSTDSQVRLDRNPLRILDSKNDQDKKIVADAPKFSSYLTEESKVFFNAVCEGLTQLNIPYSLNERLVRGLDYYNHTAFEMITTDLGTQGAILAGGRYDGLMAQMGGPEVSAIGWAMGIDRIALLLEQLPKLLPPVVIIPIGGDAMQSHAFEIAMNLRHSGIITDIGFSGNVGKRMKKADKISAQTAVLLGEEELASGKVTVRNLTSGEQKLVDIHRLIEYLQCIDIKEAPSDKK